MYSKSSRIFRSTAKIFSPGCFTAVRQRLVRDMQLVDAILSDVAYRLFDVAPSPCRVESIDHLNWSGVPQSMLLLETPQKNRAETFPGSNEFLVVVMDAIKRDHFT